MSPVLKSHLALLIVNLMYGANYVIAKGLMPTIIGPNGFIWLRVAGATAIFWLIFNKYLKKIERRDWFRLIVAALFGVTINQLFFFNGLSRTSPVNAAVIMTTTPIIVLILSFIILKDRLRIWQIIGVIIGGIGAILFTLNGQNSEFATSEGDLFIFINAFSYSIYLILVKPLMARYNAITVITIVFSIGLFFVSLWPFSIMEFSQINSSELSIENLLRIIFVVVCVTVLPYALNVYAMKTLSPAVTSVYIYLQPILAAGFVYLFYLIGKEDYTADFNWLKTLFTLLIFLGVYLVIKPYKKKVV